VWRSTHQPQPLIWLARSPTSYPALILRLNGEIGAVIAVRVDDGLITGFYAVRNPEKLSRIEQETGLRR
jgi:hypothetical protein